MSGMMSGCLAPVAEKLREWEREERAVTLYVSTPDGSAHVSGEVDSGVIYCEDEEAFECETCGMQSDMLLMFYVRGEKVFGWEFQAEVFAVEDEMVMFKLGGAKYAILA